ncbi:hypothetical protein D3876_09355 [Sphingomonas cavernae]|uniref:Uncharacterized protein n=2 Tax=Sphingomonas cavernae TaxID=2320861 RepID=A0A418WKA3_9SPHN|nr:hypothetical protein D3876_09355 [Sphingomonas cavernae]
MEAQGNILRYPLAIGARSTEFAQDDAAAVIKGMSDRADAVIESDWKELIGPCATAYPAPAGTPRLPDDPYQAALGCEALGRFMRAALASDGRYEEVMAGYNKLETSLDSKLAPLLAKHGKSSTEAAQTEKRKAMTAFAKLGRPDQVMEACVARYT